MTEVTEVLASAFGDDEEGDEHDVVATTKADVVGGSMAPFTTNGEPDIAKTPGGLRLVMTAV